MAVVTGIIVIRVIARLLRHRKSHPSSHDAGVSHPSDHDIRASVDTSVQHGVDADEYANEVMNIEKSEFERHLCTSPIDIDGMCNVGYKRNDVSGCCEECVFRPRDDGTCQMGFIPDDHGCCSQIADPPRDVPLEVTAVICKDVILPELAMMAGKVMGKILLTAGTHIAATLTASGLAMGVGGIVAKMVGKMTVRLGSGLGLMCAKIKAFSAAGPAGAVLAIFEVFSAILDILDPAGYENFTTNAMTENARMVAEVAMYTSLKEAGCDYPMIFPVQLAFPSEFTEADQCVVGTLYGEAFGRLKDDDYEMIGTLMKDIVDAMPGTATQEEINAKLDAVVFPERIVEHLNDLVIEIMNSDPVRRDKMRFDELKRILPSEMKSHVTLYPAYSKTNQIGITLTERGVIHWNSTHKNEWFDNNDIFDEIKLPDGYDPSLVAIFSDTYYELDMSNPGTKEHPNMVTKRLPKRVAMASPIGHVVAFCEKPRHKGIMGSDTKFPGAGVDPREHGVFFDSTTGRCRYTYPYCNRMGLEYKRGASGQGDCQPYPGQSAAEAVFGTTITRAFIRFGQSFERVLGKFPQCRPDEIQRGVECFHRPPKDRAITTPGGYVHGKICPSDSNDSGTTCYYGRGAGRIPDKRPCPNGQRDDGSSCWIDTYGRGSGYGIRVYSRGGGRIPDLETCPQGTRDDGSSCYADTKGCPT